LRRPAWIAESEAGLVDVFEMVVEHVVVLANSVGRVALQSNGRFTTDFFMVKAPEMDLPPPAATRQLFCAVFGLLYVFFQKGEKREDIRIQVTREAEQGTKYDHGNEIVEECWEDMIHSN